MTIDRSKRTSFEQVADLYNQARYDYPDELIEDILELSCLPMDGRILEIGCGTGNATQAFGRRGYALLGIELGERLAAHAGRNCQNFSKVKILNTTFEDWPLELAAFDLVMAFDSLHWIPPEIAYPKIARALKRDGSLALVFRAPVEQDPAWARAIAEIYQDTAPQFENPDTRFTLEWLVGTIRQAIHSSGFFCGITVRQYRWQEAVSSEEYLNRLRTFSVHQGIDEAQREVLYSRIRDVIQRFGGRVDQEASAVLFFSKARPPERDPA